MRRPLIACGVVGPPLDHILGVKRRRDPRLLRPRVVDFRVSRLGPPVVAAGEMFSTWINNQIFLGTLVGV